jgi:hypothetical protein
MCQRVGWGGADSKSLRHQQHRESGRMAGYSRRAYKDRHHHLPHDNHGVGGRNERTGVAEGSVRE